MGLLGWLGASDPGSGLLGQFDPQAAPLAGTGGSAGMAFHFRNASSPLQALHNWAQDNSDALMLMGAALSDGEGWGAASRGWVEGRQRDRVRLAQKQKLFKDYADQQALEAAAAREGFDPLVARDPVLFRQLYSEKHRRREPTEWERLTEGLNPDELRQAKRARLGLGKDAPEFTKIGEDEYGNARFGWVDRRAGTVRPWEGPSPAGAGAAPGGAPGAMPPSAAQQGRIETPPAVEIPPPPPGVNPRVWRDEQTRQAAQAGKPTEKMRSDLAGVRRSAESLKVELNRLGSLVKTYGAERMPGPAKSAMQTVYTNIQMQLKNLYDLGAITGPDMQVLTQLIENPTADGVTDYLGKSFNRGGRTAAQIKELHRIIDESVAAAERNLSGRAPGARAPQRTQNGGRTRAGVPWSVEGQ